MNQPEIKSRLVPTGAMASQLGVEPRELRAEAAAGTLPHVRVGRRGLLLDPERVIATLRHRSEGADIRAGGECHEAP